MNKNALFLLKNCKNRSALELRHQTPLFPAAGGFAPRLLMTPANPLPHWKILATPLLKAFFEFSLSFYVLILLGLLLVPSLLDYVLTSKR